MQAVILVEPESPDNTGLVARLCANFGFSLRLVAPGFNLEEARKTASNAQGKLRDAEIFDSLEAAIRDLDHVIGTKPGKGVEAGELEPRDNVSLVIGPESSGLSNDQLAVCDSVAHIDTPGYSSLNQACATAIFTHRLHEAEGEVLSQGQRERLEDVLGDSKLLELVLRANPSKGEADRLLGELERLEDGS